MRVVGGGWWVVGGGWWVMVYSPTTGATTGVSLTYDNIPLAADTPACLNDSYDAPTCDSAH